MLSQSELITIAVIWDADKMYIYFESYGSNVDFIMRDKEGSRTISVSQNARMIKSILRDEEIRKDIEIGFSIFDILLTRIYDLEKTNTGSIQI